MKAREIAACAVMVALLIAVQYAFSFVAGIELVTAFFLCFCYAFGVRCGMITATAFSLVRCILYGFVANVVVLYLIYYNAFALLFGIVGRKKLFVWVCPCLLAALSVASATVAIVGLPVSILVQSKITIMLWVLFGLMIALLVFYFVLLFANKGERGREIASVTALAAFCTVLFSLLDDVITPLMLGYSSNAAVIYFYNSFLALIPQTICAAVSVFLLFLPLKKVFGALLIDKKDL